MFIRFQTKGKIHICFFHAVQRINIGDKVDMMEPFKTDQTALIVCPYCDIQGYKIAALQQDRTDKIFIGEI